MYKYSFKFKKLALISIVVLVSGCMAGGGGMNTMTGGGTLGAVEGAVMNSMLQNMMGSNVLNGQIGSQLPSADQNFRIQQLGSVLQSGSVNQSQQWTNPKTGSSMAVTPTGQSSVNPQTQQQCQNMNEVITLPNGQSMNETRVACLDPSTGKWNLVQ